MRYYFTVFICKIFIFLLKCLGKKGTSAPGKLAFRLYPDLLKVYGKKVKYDIIAVLGTNGKTTTNNLIADYFEADGYNVVCNRIGANMDEGSVVAFLNKTNLFGKIDVDYACLEMDEGWAEYIMKFITPTKIVITNLFRDQVDRYGEVDITMEFLRRAIRLAPEAELIVNADDPQTIATVMELPNRKIYYGIKDEVQGYSAEDAVAFCPVCHKKLQYNFRHFGPLGDYYCECGFKRPKIHYVASDICLFPNIKFMTGMGEEVESGLRGMYNVYNILASVVVAVECEVYFEEVRKCILNYKPQIGRMEEFALQKPVCLVLAKNPVGFNQSVTTMMEDPRTKDVIIAINDALGDGKDVSWLWDVDFEKIEDETVMSKSVVGTRYGDMAVRLKYAGIDEAKIGIARDADEKIDELLSNGKGEVIYILANYTAVFPIQAGLKEREKNYEN